MGTTETHRDTESLHGSSSDVGAHLTRRFADTHGEEILDHDGAHFVLSESGKQLGVVMHVSDVVGGLANGTAELVCLVPREFGYFTEDKLDT